MGADRLLRRMSCGCLVSSGGSRPRRHLTNEARWQRVATPAAAGLHVTRVRRIPDGWRGVHEGVRALRLLVMRGVGQPGGNAGPRAGSG